MRQAACLHRAPVRRRPPRRLSSRGRLNAGRRADSPNSGARDTCPRAGSPLPLSTQAQCRMPRPISGRFGTPNATPSGTKPHPSGTTTVRRGTTPRGGRRREAGASPWHPPRRPRSVDGGGGTRRGRHPALDARRQASGARTNGRANELRRMPRTPHRSELFAAELVRFCGFRARRAARGVRAMTASRLRRVGR